MLTSIAAIAGAVIALIGVGWFAWDQIKKISKEKKDEQRRKTETEITEALTNEERAKLAKAVSDNRSK